MSNKIYTIEEVSQLSRNRNSIYGIAILMVVFYHLWIGKVPGSIFFLPFRYGYIGVDIFLLFSGYGLCHSYSNNSLKKYYFNRFMRIIPVYVFFNVCFDVIACIQGKALLISDIFYNLSTLSWYGFGTYGGGNKCFDWFTAAILLLYLIFPLLFRLTKIARGYLFLICVLTAFTYQHVLGVVPWRIDCLISRIPVFVFGILLYLREKEQTTDLKIPLITSAVFFYLGIIYSSWFFQTAMIAPFILLFLGYILNAISDECIIKKGLSVIGRNSYELMVANSWSQQFVNIFPSCFFGYIFSSVVFHLGATSMFTFVRRISDRIVKLLESSPE